MDDINAYIDRRLDDLRPDRYNPKDHTWQSPLVAEVAALIPAASACQIAADARIRSRETTATRAVTKLLRDIHRTGQRPLGWLDVARRPLALDKQRVSLDEATSSDFRSWASLEARRAGNDFAVRHESCEGAIALADMIDAVGGYTIRDLP